ncbi:MAG: hypothetical protein JWM43_3687 [Acidobacteriaceae bacterium]|nr:hypothetical protein [Acidobacteriaceae bacterium]
MPRPTPSSKKRQPASSPRSGAPSNAPELVDPQWIVKGLGLILLAAILCGYLSLCLLFYIGQWQIVLHPKRTSDHPAALSGTPVQFLSFAPDESAVPQLTAWSIPATPGGRYPDTTLLYLPAGDGSLADAIPTLTALHDLGINVFAIDYRGYGQSANTTHPGQKILAEDAELAWQYLHATRSLSEKQILPYGAGVGASLAAHLSATHPQTAAVILDSPHGDLLQTVLHDDRTKLLPARLLFHERFPLTAPLSTLHTPKLLLSGSTLPPAFQSAADPRITVELNAVPGSLSTQPGFAASIKRFLDQYLPPTPPPQLILNPAPSR